LRCDVSLIWAQAANGVIGRDGALPWRLPEDLARFRALTIGATVLMGRATWDSLPTTMRPLPGRRNLVLTRQPDWSAAGATTVHSLDAGISEVDGDLWVIGGSQIYAAALGYARRAVVTELQESFEGDTHAPTLDAEWSVAERDPGDGWLASSAGLNYRVTTYIRPG